MSKKEELFSATGRDKLKDLYSNKEFSIRQVAKELGVYPVLVYQALLHHEIPVRNKSSAQSKALDKGRSTHPTKGKQREQKTKVKIGETLYKKWKANRKELTEKWRKKGVEVWNSISDEKKEEIKERASQALKKSSQFGSKLEEFLFSYLSINNFRCVHHKKHLVSAEQLEIDIFLPEDAICIEVDGISHFYPIFGEQDLQRRIDADNKKNGLLLAAGYVIIRIRNLKNFVSQAALRDVGGKLVKILNRLKVSFPESVEERLIYLDIGDMINE